MEVILLEKVGKLGNIGDKVNVKAGYGRNYLVPTNKAVFATAANLEAFEARRAELEAAAAEQRTAADTRGAQLAGLETITIAANAGDEGKLFGSEVVKSEVKLPEGALREIGEYDIDIQLHSDVTQAIKLAVVAE